MGRIPKAISLCYQTQKGESNIIVYALSRRYTLLVSLGTHILGFDNIKELYEHDINFASTFVSCLKKSFDEFYFSEEYIFNKRKLCIPQGFIRRLVLQESHKGGLMGHYGVDETITSLKRKYYWPHTRIYISKALF